MQNVEAFIATPKEDAPIVMEGLLASRSHGKWKKPRDREKFHTFALLDGEKDQERIGEILSRNPDDIRTALILLMVDNLVEIKTRKGRPITMNALLLDKSFKKIKPNGTEFAHAFYTRLFALADTLAYQYEQERKHLLMQNRLSDEHAKTLASKIAFCLNVRLLFKNTNMHDLYHAFLQKLALIIAGVTEHRDIRSMLIEHGKKHIEYGVLPEHYPLVGQALIETLREYLADEWSQELEDAWSDAYAIVSALMQSAADG
jgi:hemoglobin-like flavoprotein